MRHTLVDHQGGDDGEHHGHTDHDGRERGDPVARGAHTPGLSCLRAPGPIHEGAELCRAAGLLSFVLFAHAFEPSGSLQVTTGQSGKSQLLCAGPASAGRAPTGRIPALLTSRESTITLLVRTTN